MKDFEKVHMAAFANHVMSTTMSLYITNFAGFKDEVDERLNKNEFRITVDGEPMDKREEIEMKLSLMFAQLAKQITDEWFNDELCDEDEPQE